MAAAWFVGEVGGDALELAIGFFGGELGGFVVEDVREIDFDPTQVLWQRQAVGSRVHAGGDVDDGVDAEWEGFLDEAVDGGSADGEGESDGFGVGQGSNDLAAAIACEFGGKVVVKNSVGPRGFFGADCGDPECGI